MPLIEDLYYAANYACLEVRQDNHFCHVSHTLPAQSSKWHPNLCRCSLVRWDVQCSTWIVVESPWWKSEVKQVAWKHCQGSLPVTCEGCEATKRSSCHLCEFPVRAKAFLILQKTRSKCHPLQNDDENIGVS